MSYVFAAPELVEAAAQNLAGIRSAVGQATAAAAGPTTGVMAAGLDEVSAAVSQLFGTYGKEFQDLNAQAAAFHEEFVSLLNAGAGAYARAEASGAQGLLNGVGAAVGTVAGPYQALVANTANNLQSLGGALAANPAPFLRQLVTNQIGYGQAFASALQRTFANLPAVLAGAPASIQAAFQALLAANPTAFVQQVISNQVGFAQTVATALQSAAQDFQVGLQALPASFQAAGQDLMTGDITGAANNVGSGFVNLFLTGFDVTVGPTDPAGDPPLLTITPTGTLGDLLPIFSIPGQMAQNLTNLIPPSIPAQMAQNATNVINTVTNTSVTSVLNAFADPNSPIGLGIDIDTNMGLPLALGLDALGGPVSGLSAFGSSASAFVNAIQSGDPLGAAAAVLDAPAVVANGFLNGHTTFPLTVTALGIPTTLNLPLDGILVPPGPYTALVDLSGLGLGPLFLDSTVTGTPLGGIVPALLNFLPEQLAEAIGAPV